MCRSCSSFWGFPMLPIFFQGSSLVCFLLLLPSSPSCISSKKSVVEGWEKGIVGSAPPGAAQCFSFVKAEGAELPVCTHAEIYCCLNVETFGGKRWIFLPAFQPGEVIQCLVAFFICAINLTFYWSVCTDPPKLHIIFIIICVCFLNKKLTRAVAMKIN